MLPEALALRFQALQKHDWTQVLRLVSIVVHLRGLACVMSRILQGKPKQELLSVETIIGGGVTKVSKYR